MSKQEIHVSELEDVAWNNSETYRYILGEATDVWQINLPLNISKINILRELLSVDEQDKANRYLREADKHRYTLARSYLRLLLSRYLQIEPQIIEFETDKNKKPRIKKTQGNIYYNVSHSGDYVLIAICTHEVGIDVELLNPDVHYLDVMEISFDQAEIAYVNKSLKPLEDFYKIWTRKEALLKATGSGINDDIRKVPGLNGSHSIDITASLAEENYFVQTLNLGEKHIAAIANHSRKIHFLLIG